MAAAGPVKAVDCYKYQWARFVARKRLLDDLKIVTNKVAPVVDNLPEPTKVDDLVDAAYSGKNRFAPSIPGQFKVGIVGAGVSGLFTALIFDFLKEHVPDLNITYDILEAAGDDRLGGRVFTHRFSNKIHDYYDVGAMRFPQNKIMDRTFRLFKFLELDKKLIPYYYKDFEGVCPSYFNDVRQVGSWEGKDDAFNMNPGLPEDDQIDPELLKRDPGKVMDAALKAFIDKAEEGLKKKAEKNDITDEENDPFWQMMMKADFMTTREFLRSTKNSDPDDPSLVKIPDGPGYNFNTIEWLETFNLGTGWYNQSLTETVMETLDFRVDESKNPQFYCLDGGTQQVAEYMAKKLKTKPEFRRQVTAIQAEIFLGKENPMTLKINNGYGTNRGTESRSYFAVFNSTTLGAMQRMDLTKAGLLYGTKQAIRSLNYGASCKVGMKFKTPWWRSKDFKITKGGLGKTDLPLRVCVYPSYNIDDPMEESAVLLCCYNWAQDAQRLGTLISEDSPKNEEELINVLFHNLALLHANENKDYQAVMKLLNEQYLEHHAYDWYEDKNTSGAFAWFGPGQFSKMWPEIYRPNANGHLYLIGEAASAHHGWIVGALESAVRGVYSLFEGLSYHNPTFEGYKAAIELLENGPAHIPEIEPLPCFPPPKEMPVRQLNVPRTLEPEEQPLSYVASEFLLSRMQSIVETGEPKKIEVTFSSLAGGQKAL